MLVMFRVLSVTVLLVFYFIVSSCSNDVYLIDRGARYIPKLSFSTIHSDFAKYYSLWNIKYGRDARHIPSGYMSMSDDSILAVCEILQSFGNDKLSVKAEAFTNMDRQIVVNSDLWFGLTEAEKEQVFFHELGHCDLNRGHTEKMVYTGDDRFPSVPNSIMYPSKISHRAYVRFRDHYLKEIIDETKELRND